MVHTSWLQISRHPTDMSKEELKVLLAMDLDENYVEKIVAHEEKGKNPKNWSFKVRWVGYQMLAHFNEKHHITIPKENGIVKRANKEVNRHIQNILFDKGKFQIWSKMLCMTEKRLNSSIKEPIGVSPNTSFSVMPFIWILPSL